MPGAAYVTTPRGRSVVLTRSELDAFECHCDNPACDGRIVELKTECGHPLRAVYLKDAGAILILCAEGCLAGSAIRVASEA